MKLFSESNLFTKTFIVLGLTMIIYGIISKLIPIYFFWESTSFGFAFILIGILSVLITKRSSKNVSKNNKKGFLIGIIFICFIFLIQSLLIIITINSDAYKAAKTHITYNEVSKSEIGKIKGFGLIPIGSFSVQSNSKGTTGNANFNLILKGEDGYKKISVFLYKDYEKDWEVIEIY